MLFLFIGASYGQPGGGNGNGNGNGGGHGGGAPGNGNGNDPCSKPNPPPSCTGVPIRGEFILVAAGLCIGFVGLRIRKGNNR